MKHLYVISGAMGVGKTAVCQQLKPLLAPCAFLDGDWCWDMEPFTVNKENRTMVMGHIQYLLRGFLQNSGYENVIFLLGSPSGRDLAGSSHRAVRPFLCAPSHHPYLHPRYPLSATICGYRPRPPQAGCAAEKPQLPAPFPWTAHRQNSNRWAHASTGG